MDEIAYKESWVVLVRLDDFISGLSQVIEFKNVFCYQLNLLNQKESAEFSEKC